MYSPAMRRIQLYVDEDVDDALTAKAAILGTSRSALVRDAVRASLGAHLDTVADAVDSLVGDLDIDPDDDIDAVIYGLSGPPDA